MDNLKGIGSRTILIGGTGRSGTNILKEIIGNHSEVCLLPFEYRFIIDPSGIVDFYNSIRSSWSPYFSDHKIKELENFLKNLSHRNYIKYIISKIIKIIDKKGLLISPERYTEWELSKWIPDYDKYVDELIENLKDFKYRGIWPGTRSFSVKNRIFFTDFRKDFKEILSEFVLKCIKSILKNENKTYYVEDNTWNILYIKELSELIPKNKFIHVIRDPRDVVSSMINQRWCPSSLREAIDFYASIMDRYIESKNKLKNNKIVEVKLENIVSETESEIKNIFDKLNIEFDTKLLDVDLSSSHSGRWKKEIKKKTFLNERLNKYLTYFNYN